MDAKDLAELAVAIGDREDEKRVLAAVGAYAKVLRGRDVSVDRLELAEGLTTLLDHPSPEVRQEVAGVCDAFPEPYFTRALETLTRDADRFVQNAAKRAGDRRARVRKEQTRDETREQVLEAVLETIDADHGKGARRLAERAVRRGVEHFVGRMEHEVRKSDRAIERALAALQAEIAKPDVSVATLAREATALQAHFGFMRSMIRRAHEYAAHVKPVFADASLAEIVDEARRHLFERLGARAGAVHFANDVGGELRACVDRHALLQALQNVMQNAVEAYGDGNANGRLPLRVSARVLLAGAQVELRVEDEGQGMTADGLAKMFLPFGSCKPGGTGVGMLIVQKMVEDVHEGELVVESVVEKGTSVVMRVPTKQKGAKR
jgi:signal transduction histidine kinase